LSGLAGILVGLTAAIAQWREVPEIGIDETEAKELMTASQNVLRHYAIETTQKGADVISLVGVIAMIGGTRISAYNLRTRMEREEQKQQRPFGGAPAQGGNMRVVSNNDSDGGF
jgi:hypothetical protein